MQETAVQQVVDAAAESDRQNNVTDEDELLEGAGSLTSAIKAEAMVYHHCRRCLLRGVVPWGIDGDEGQGSKEGEEWTVRWVNDNGESQKPFDVLLQRKIGSEVCTVPRVNAIT